MTDTPLLIGLPSKGRLQENCTAFFERAGMSIRQGGGGRDYRGVLSGVDGAEIVFLSASEIAGQLAAGAIHLGVTGEDLVRETITRADDRVAMITPLGFGHANVVVAVPQAWIDVNSMADLEDVAATYRALHGRRLKVATKYIALTRAFFARHGVSDYLIVESLGATEGAPSSGAADIIVDITTTGSTLAANALKVIGDGVILRSEANLVASLTAGWGQRARASASTILSRIAAERRARSIKEIRCALQGADVALAAAASEAFQATTPFGLPGAGAPLTFHAPRDAVHALAAWLAEKGARAITVSAPDFVFEPTNPLMDALLARLKD
ncbi:MAG: ATP phosphoribosyltransferase [Labrys sp. (in: a-proteobacteria)]